MDEFKKGFKLGFAAWFGFVVARFVARSGVLLLIGLVVVISHAIWGSSK